MLITQPNLVAWGVALSLDIFVVGLLLKFLSMIEVLLISGYQILELEG